jgi:hypothetical protein
MNEPVTRTAPAVAHDTGSARPALGAAGRDIAGVRVGATVAACLAALPFLQALGFGFVNYDDPGHVADHPVVRGGLSFGGVAWACGLGEPVPDAWWFNWPLTWLSHMADVTLHGSWAGGHHLTNVCLHAANAALVVAFVRSLGVTTAAATFVGTVFAVHPVQVESVAWVSERKTLVSGLFMLLTLLVYVAASRGARAAGRQADARSAAAVLGWTGLGALALLGKPMAVVLPVLMLLLDTWPLGRRAASDPRHTARLIAEKLPLVALALAVGVWTIWSQRQAGAVRGLGEIPPAARVANAVCATVEYLGMLVWPVNLAVFYPHPGRRPAWQVIGSLAVLGAISWWCWRRRHDVPALSIGWLWFLVSLAPMIGIIQVGNQSRADRYLYLAMLGPLVALVAGLPPAAHRAMPRGGPVREAGAVPWPWLTVAVAIVCLPLTWRQVTVWQDSRTLFTHALATGHESAVAHTNLGLVLTESGRPAEALPHLLRAVELRDDAADAWFNLGNAQAALGDLPAARGALERSVSLDPGRFKAWNNLGIVHVLGGDPAAAEAAWRRSLALRPDFVDAGRNLARLLRARGGAASGSDPPEHAHEDRQPGP